MDIASVNKRKITAVSKRHLFLQSHMTFSTVTVYPASLIRAHFWPISAWLVNIVMRPNLRCDATCCYSDDAVAHGSCFLQNVGPRMGHLINVDSLKVRTSEKLSWVLIGCFIYESRTSIVASDKPKTWIVTFKTQKMKWTIVPHSRRRVLVPAQVWVFLVKVLCHIRISGRLGRVGPDY